MAKRILSLLFLLSLAWVGLLKTGGRGTVDADRSGESEHVVTGTCGEGCEHGAIHPISRKVTDRVVDVGWEDAEVGDSVELGFEVGGQTRGTVTLRDRTVDGREIVALALENGGDLFIAALGERWEGRLLRLDEGSGWTVRGDAGKVSVEEFAASSMICAWDRGKAGTPAGLPPFLGPVPEDSPPVPPVEETIPVLNSLPGANGVIYLDFDGEVVSGTQWNTSYNNGNPINAGSPNFTSAQIETVWKGVAEDYLPFNVTVTTDRSVYDGYPISRRAMLVFTPDNEWYGSSGGVAYVDVFGSPTFDAPGWVFTDMLANSADYASEAASHEAGHMLGLRHDGTSSEGYYEGHGSGATSWAPIMGIGYYSQVTQWSRGEYPDANNSEDDLAIISGSRNGLGYRNDDHSGTGGGGTPVDTFGEDGISGSGIIERNTDVDLFSLQTSGGTVSIVVENANYDPNLDVRLRLLSGAGAEVAVSDPPSGLDASLTLAIGAGTYQLEVSGTGAGDLSSGYGDYGSLGSYSISGTVPRDLVLAAEVVSPSAPEVSLTEGTGLLLEGLVSGGTSAWEVVSVPPDGQVTIADPSQMSTEAVFSGRGTYLLRLKGVSDSEEVFDELVVSVEAPGAEPLHAAVAPSVDLGRDRTVYGDRLVMEPLVSDDGPGGALDYEWSVRSGSGQLSSTVVENPTLGFAEAGVTALRLVVGDGVSRTFDDVVISANFRIESLIAEGAPAKAWVVADDRHGIGWRNSGFDDSGWLSGSLGAGFDAVNGPSSKRIFAPLIGSGLDVESSMYRTRVGCYIRVPFEVTDPRGLLSMRLRMKFDDGFVAYVNGIEVARDNVGSGEPGWDAVAAADRRDEDALSAVSFMVDLASVTLHEGVNVLAIHGMNSSKANGERTFLMSPELEVTLTETPFFAAMSVIADPDLRGASDDGDGDGRPNLLEHAAGTPSQVADQGYRMVNPVGLGETTLVLPSSAPDDVLYVFECSADLSPPWTEIARRKGSGSWAGQQPLEVTDVGDGREELRFATSDAPSCFFRLKIELVDP